MLLHKVRRATNVLTTCEKLESFVETYNKKCSILLYMTNSYYHLSYFIGMFQLLQSYVLMVFDAWINVILKAVGVHIWYNGNLFLILLLITHMYLDIFQSILVVYKNLILTWLIATYGIVLLFNQVPL